MTSVTIEHDPLLDWGFPASPAMVVGLRVGVAPSWFVVARVALSWRRTARPVLPAVTTPGVIVPLVRLNGDVP